MVDSTLAEVFYAEAQEHLDVMEALLLEARSSAISKEQINELFRAAHSIKGAGSALGLGPLTEYVHDLEYCLDDMRSGRRRLGATEVDALLGVLDVLRAAIDALSQGAPWDIGAHRATLEALRSMPEGTARSSAKLGRDNLRVEIRFAEDALIVGVEPVALLGALAELGQIDVQCDASRLPDFNDLDPLQCYLQWRVTIVGATRAEVESLLDWGDHICQFTIEEMPSDEPRPDVAASVDAEAPAPPATTRDAASIRVPITKLDELMNALGELVITQTMLQSLVDRGVTQTMLQSLREGLERLEANTSALQELVTNVRMVPAGFLLRRVPRVVHSVSSALEKKVELKITGESTEVDKRVLEELVDPLMHIVRNAIDHGIESPAVRRAAGKLEAGTVNIDAAQKNGFFELRISEDGAGLDAERIVSKAVAMGILESGVDPATVNVASLIFAPGLTTAAQVTSVSGRGVGMDVVRKNIEALGGAISLTTQPGKGTSFLIRLPLTLAIIEGQLFRIDNETYVLPVLSMIESLRESDVRVRRLPGGGHVCRFRGKEIPVVCLRTALGLPSQGYQRASIFITADGAQGPVAMAVDELLGQQQVVVKSLQRHCRRLPGISGATILGDGTVAMILDIPSISAKWHASASIAATEVAWTQVEHV